MCVGVRVASVKLCCHIRHKLVTIIWRGAGRGGVLSFTLVLMNGCVGCTSTAACLLFYIYIYIYAYVCMRDETYLRVQFSVTRRHCVVVWGCGGVGCRGCSGVCFITTTPLLCCVLHSTCRVQSNVVNYAYKRLHSTTFNMTKQTFYQPQ